MIDVDADDDAPVGHCDHCGVWSSLHWEHLLCEGCAELVCGDCGWVECECECE